MEFLYWIVIGVFLLLLLIGIKDWIFFLLSSWAENGGKFTLLLIIFICLFISPAIVKDYAPEYYGLSIWALILYAAGLLVYKHMFKRGREKRTDENF